MSKNILGAEAIAIIFCQKFLECHPYKTGKSVQAKVSGGGRTLYGHHFQCIACSPKSVTSGKKLPGIGPGEGSLRLGDLDMLLDESGSS